MNTPCTHIYSGYENYKNVKSGNYRRVVCPDCNCGQFIYNPYNNIIEPPLRDPVVYQQLRESEYPGIEDTVYTNYLRPDYVYVYPTYYTHGFWPDEQGEVTNIPSRTMK